mmetsp:Transcript_21863/g.61116  ORF Transcript_21863/g.61116 Transcript_21863/m.61116 type:complete len:239 (+) Transcript_21863:434-1150(+)
MPPASSSSPPKTASPAAPSGRLSASGPGKGSSRTRSRARRGRASTSWSALATLALARPSLTYCLTEVSCSPSVEVGIHCPIKGSTSSKSAGAPRLPPSFLRRPGSRRRSDVRGSADRAMAPPRAAAAPAAAAPLGAGGATARSLSNFSRNESFSFGSTAAASSSASSSSLASALEAFEAFAASASSFSAFLTAFSAFLSEGRRRSSKGAALSCSSLSHTSCDTTGCVRTSPPSARSST